jgi:hypothetical protein
MTRLHNSLPGRAGRGAALLLLGFAVMACLPGRGEAERTLIAFLDAVQAENLDTLYCRLAGASHKESGIDDPAARRAAFDAWARARYETYLAGRDRGGVELEDDGIALVKTFALGKGTFYRIVEVRPRSLTHLEVDTEVRFAYGHIDLGVLTPGVTFYAAGAPPGRIHATRVPEGHDSITQELLESVTVRWTLRRMPASEACPAGWTVEAARPVPQSATTTRITWTF